MPKKKTPTVKERIRLIYNADYYRHITKKQGLGLSQADTDWIRKLGDDYIWCVTLDNMRDTIVIWAQHRYNEGGHACLDAAGELIDEGMEVIYE